MAFLDWVKNRGQAVSAPANEQGNAAPETAKQMYTREATEEKLSQPKVPSMDAGQRAKAVEAVQAVNALSANVEQQPDATSAPTATPAPNDGAENPQAMKQMSMAQDKTAPALSPSSAQMGMKDVDGPEAPKPTPTPTSPKPTRSPSPDL